MKAPLPLDVPPLTGGAHPNTANGESRFVQKVSVLCDNAFKLIGYFVYTCIAFGVLSATCSQNPFLWLFVFFLGLLFWLYIWSVTFGVFGHWMARRVKTPSWRRWTRIGVNASVIVFACASFVLISFSDLIDAYVLRLFPEAAQCDMYSGAPAPSEGGSNPMVSKEPTQ